MRIGIFGGTFDPVHYGHLLLAESCREACRLDRVLLVPAATPPHKQRRTFSSGTHRLAMLELALGGHPGILASDIELIRGGVSYTVETLRSLKQQGPDDELFFLLGADSLNELPTWFEPAEICRLALPVVVGRGGSPPPDWQLLAPLVSAERLELIRSHHVSMPLIELSSTDIRQRVASGRSIRFRTPRAVEEYIAAQRLFQAK